MRNLSITIEWLLTIDVSDAEGQRLRITVVNTLDRKGRVLIVDERGSRFTGLGIKYPIAIDNQSSIWSAFKNPSTPQELHVRDGPRPVFRFGGTRWLYSAVSLVRVS